MWVQEKESRLVISAVLWRTAGVRERTTTPRRESGGKYGAAWSMRRRSSRTTTGFQAVGVDPAEMVEFRGTRSQRPGHRSRPRSNRWVDLHVKFVNWSRQSFDLNGFVQIGGRVGRGLCGSGEENGGKRQPAPTTTTDTSGLIRSVRSIRTPVTASAERPMSYAGVLGMPGVGQIRCSIDRIG